MKKSKVLALSIALQLFALGLLGQDCKVVLSSCFEKLNNIQTPPENVVYFLDMSIETNATKKSEAIPTIDAKIYVTSNSYFFESQLYSIYIDKEEFYYVDFSQKLIIHRVGNVFENRDQNIGNIISNEQSELISNGTISICRDSIYNNKKYLFISISPDANIESKYQIKNVNYFISKKSENRIEKTRIEYNAKSKIKNKTITYNDISYNYKGLKSFKASDFIYDKNKQLKAKFKGFTLTE